MTERDESKNDAILFEATMLASEAHPEVETTAPANAAAAFEATMLATPVEVADAEFEATTVVSATNPIVEETMVSTRDPQPNATKEVTAPEPEAVVAPVSVPKAVAQESESSFERRIAELPDQSTAPAREVQEVVEIKRKIVVPEPTRNLGGKDRAELWKQNKKRQQMQATRIVVMIVIGAAAIGAGIAIAVTMLVK